MSQVSMSRPARATRAGRPDPRRQLRVVQGAAAVRVSWFPVLCITLLVSGLIGVLMLNTALAEGSFQLGRLQASSSGLADRQESLTHTIEEQRAPAHLAERAMRLGMVPADSAAFLRLSDGAILGVATPATRPQGFTVATAPKATGGSSATKRSSAPSTPGSATPSSARTTSSSGPVARQNGGRSSQGPTAGASPDPSSTSAPAGGGNG